MESIIDCGDGHALAASRSLPRNDHGREIYILIKCTTVSKLLTWIEKRTSSCS